jgi:hypothetical protein
MLRRVVAALMGMFVLYLGGCSDTGESTSNGAAAFAGVCLGWERQFYDENTYGDACRANFASKSDCEMVEGCRWTADTFCQGFPKPCRTYGQAACATALGCQWYAPPRCDSELACNKDMYVADGGCSDVPDYVISTCSGQAYVDFTELCGHKAPSSGFDMTCP